MYGNQFVFIQSTSRVLLHRYIRFLHICDEMTNSYEFKLVVCIMKHFTTIPETACVKGPLYTSS